MENNLNQQPVIREDATRQQQLIKEIFMSDVQQNSRPCAYLHCRYTIVSISKSQLLPADQVIDAIAARLTISKGI
jgi:hypothetical protein